MKKPVNKANKPVKRPQKKNEPAVQTNEKAPITTGDGHNDASNGTVQTNEEAQTTTGKFRIPRRLREWIRESQFLATTLSIILTFGTTGLVEYCQRVKDRKMSAIMVLSTIENFSTTVDMMAQDIARCDSIGTWLLSLPQDSLDKIQPEEVHGILNEMLSLVDYMSHDKTAENIFGNSFETWKNMGNRNYRFIESVGESFARINADESNWNEWVKEYEKTINNVLSQMQPGEHTLTKLLNDNGVRQKLESFHVRKYWLDYISAHNHYLNKRNLSIIGLKEEDIKAYTERRKREKLPDEPQPSEFRSEQLKPDSLFTLKAIKLRIDSILQDKMPPKSDEKLNEEESQRNKE
jgi:hypothetical protein